jgi:hypothetical protein
MWQQLLANNARSTLSVAVTTNTQPSLTLQSGHGARFPVIQPGDYCEVTLDDGTNVEICRVVANASDALTVLRGIEGTTAQSSFAIGTRVQLRWTRDTAIRQEISSILDMKFVKAVGNVASFSMVGVVVPTLTNSQVAATLTNSSVREQSERVRLTMANSAQNPSRLFVPQPCVEITKGFRFNARFGVAFLANSSHMFLGLVNTTGAMNSVHPPSSLTQALAIGWDNAGSLQGTNLAMYFSGAGPATKTDLGSYFNVNTSAWYEVEWYAYTGLQRVDWVVRRLDVSSIADSTGVQTAVLPANSLWLSPMLAHSTMVTSANAIELGAWSWVS